MKRSVSPQSVPDGQLQLKKARLAYGIFSAFKKVFTPSHKEASKALPTDEVHIDITTDEISNSFVNRKRSVRGSIAPPSSAIPRSSISGPSSNTAYNALYTSLSEPKGEPFLAVEQDLQREVSPSVYLPRNPILPLNPEEMELEAESDEYDSLYRDEDGNLVRPPFINLDPKERYQMLQMKKSVEASQVLQDSLKYMVDPDETTSISRPGNRVDTSTQTYNEEYLEKKLHFNAARKKLALASRSQRKKPRVLFLGNFLYDRSKAPAPEKGLKLLGYLAEVSKPGFSPVATSQGKDALQRSRFDRKPAFTGKTAKDANQLDQAYIERSNKLSSILRVKDQPKSTSVGPSSGFSFEVSKDKFTTAPTDPKINEVEKAGNIAFKGKENAPKENPKKPENTSKLPETDSALKGSDSASKPLFAPPFDDGAQDDRPAKKTRTGDESEAAPAPLFSFGLGPKPSSESKATGLFAPKPNNGTSEKNEPKLALPAFNFGEKADGKAAPLFSISKAESKEKAPALFSFQKDTEEKTEEKKDSDEAPKQTFLFGEKSTKPTFSFGKPTSSDDTKDSTSQIPKVSFQTTSSTGTAKPSLFGDKPDGEPKFSFGASKAPSEPKPAFSFGDKASLSTPAFSFGAKAPEKKEETEKNSSFAFGAKEKPEKQVTPFTFGKVETPVSGESNANDKKTPFSLTKEATSGPEVAKPPFSFGQAKDKTPSTTPAPAFSFGTTPVPEQSASANTSFSFGQSATADPALIFGNPNASALAPVAPFKFSNTLPTATTPLPALQGNSGGFSFSSNALGASRSVTPATPSINFGGNTSFGTNNNGANNSGAVNNGFSNSFSFGGASAPVAPSGAFGDRARTATPSGTTPFGFNQTPAAPNFGAPSGNGFPNNAVPNNAFNSAPGSFGQPSRESTPPAFGGMGNFPNGSAPGQLFTPPVANASGRRIAQMRQRKRY